MFNDMMFSSKVRNKRLEVELKKFSTKPPCGLSFYPVDDTLTKFEAQIAPGKNSIYHGSIFRLEIEIPEKYPFFAPTFQFITPIFHPNIDATGRICLDILTDNYTPTMEIVDLLIAIETLLDCPNFDDPLRPEVADIYKANESLYYELAKKNSYNPSVIMPKMTSTNLNNLK